MSYQKQNFANGEVLSASQLNHIEQGIVDVESAANATKAVVDKIIDPTLSLSGKAADAAKVGEAINAEAERAKGVESQIKEDINKSQDAVYYESDTNKEKTVYKRLNIESGKTYFIYTTTPINCSTKNIGTNSAETIQNLGNISKGKTSFVATNDASYFRIYSRSIGTVVVICRESYNGHIKDAVDTLESEVNQIGERIKNAEYEIGNHGVIIDLVGDGLKLDFYLSDDRTEVITNWNEEIQKNISADTTMTLKYLGYTGQYLRYIRIDGKKSDGTYSALKSLNNPVVGDELTVKTSFDLVGIRIQISRTQKEFNVSFNGTIIIYKDGLLRDVNAIKSDLNQTSPAKVYHVEKDGSGDFTRLVDAIEEAEKYMDSIVYVGDGEWDIIDELGSDYVNSVSYTQRGIVLKNRIKIVFSSKSKVICNYSGSNTTIMNWLSPFNAGKYGFTLENLNIYSRNVRYSVHDERDSNDDFYINRYVNCHFYNHNENGGYRQCIGGGLGKNGYIIIENCIFENPKANKNSLISYHNTANAGGGSAKSNIEVSNCYVKGTGTLRFSWYGTSTDTTIVKATGNNLGSAIQFVAETSDGTSPNENVELYEWNNIIHSN